MQYILLTLICWIGIYLAPVVWRLDSTIHWIILYRLDNAVGFSITYLLDGNLSLDIVICSLYNWVQIFKLDTFLFTFMRETKCDLWMIKLKNDVSPLFEMVIVFPNN